MNILVTSPVREHHKTYLERQAADDRFIYAKGKEVTRELVADADVIIGNVPQDMIQASPKLKWVQLNSAGTEGYCEQGVLAEGTTLTNATGAYGLAISEHMVAGVLMLKKKLHLYYKNQLEQNWQSEGSVTSILGSTTLVIGLGDIGCEFAGRMKALGSYTIGVKRRGGEKPDCVEELYQNEKLDELLPKADIVALTVPGNASTRHMIGKERLALMKKDAIIVNVGRGIVIDTDALAEALDQKQLGGAVLDVTDPEPLPADHPLWNAENALITPHISGGYALQETFERVIRIAGENLRRFKSGEELENIIDFQTGYKK